MPCLSDYTSAPQQQPSCAPQQPSCAPEFYQPPCQTVCPPINYESSSYSQGCSNFHIPTASGGLTFTSTDYSQQLACGVGHEISFAAFMQMGSALGNAAQALVVLAMDQCNKVLNENEALIATPSSSSSTSTTTIYHEKICAGGNTPTGATDAYIQNYKGSDGFNHQEITYVDANGKKVGQRDYVLDNNKALGNVIFAQGGDVTGTGKFVAGDTVTIQKTNYILVDTGKTDCDGNKVYSLDTVDANGKDTGQSVGTISFNANGTVDHSALLDYSTITGDSFVPGLQSATTTVPFSGVSTPLSVNGSIVGGTFSRTGFIMNNMTYKPDTQHNFTDATGVKYDAFTDPLGNIVYLKDTDYQGLSDPLHSVSGINIYTSTTWNSDGDKITDNGVVYSRDTNDDVLGTNYIAYKNDSTNTKIYVDSNDRNANPGRVSKVTFPTTNGAPIITPPTFNASASTLTVTGTNTGGVYTISTVTINGVVYTPYPTNNYTDPKTNIKYDAIKSPDGKIVYIADSEYQNLNNSSTSATVYSGANWVLTPTSDIIIDGGVNYTRYPTGDKNGYLAYQDPATTNIIYVSLDDRNSNPGHVTTVSFAAPSGLPDAYATYTSGGKGVTLSEVTSTAGIPTTLSTQTTVSSSTADPLTTMAAVFKYAEVYAEAMTMISTYYQNNIDAYKNRPH